MIRTALRLAWKAFLRYQAHNGPDRAAAVAYYTLLSLLPLFIFVISLGTMVAGSFEAAYANSMVLLRGFVVQLDPATMDALRSFVERAARFQWPAVLLFAWTSRRIFASLFSALGVVFDAPDGHGFAKGNLLAFGMVAVMGLGQLATMLLATFLATGEGLMQRFAGPGGATVFGSLTGAFVAHVLPVLVTASFFFLLYRLAPGRIIHNADAALGAFLATVFWEAAKAGFAYYVRHLARYAGLYGALEGVIVLALWVELSVSIILYCGEIVALRAATILSRAAANSSAALAFPPR